MGTPLIWAGAFHLFIGNLLIGILEGTLLARFSKVGYGRAIASLIAANYFSAWLGVIAIYRIEAFLDITIENLLLWFIASAAIAYLLSVVLELPFVWLALRRASFRFPRILAASAAINGVSYVLLFGWYSLASYTSMMTDLTVVSAAELAPTSNYRLYYVARDTDEVISCDLAGQNVQRIDRVPALPPNVWTQRLFATEDQPGTFNLCTSAWLIQAGEGREIILRDFCAVAGVANESGTVKLGADTGWDYSLVDWEGQPGVRVVETTTQAVHRFSLETPFADFRPRIGTQIDGDLLIFDLNNDQICILHAPTKRIALIARGSSPVVVIPHPE